MKSQLLQAVIHKSVLLSFLLYLIPKQDTLQKSIMHATWSEEAGNTNLFTHSTHVGGVCQYTKNTYQENRAFMQGITIHEAWQ